MRATDILREKLSESLSFLHMKRETALWRMVDGLLQGQRLVLTDVGRSLPGASSMKHRIKAVDRFLGSAAMQMAITRIYAALAAVLLRRHQRPVIIVDWTGTGSGFWLLSAKLAFEGRALTILSRAYPEKRKANPLVERRFLRELQKIIPEHCRPILVTDAGFLFKWIDEVRALGWDYIGRARLKKMVVRVKGRCMRLVDVYGLARRKPRDLGTAWLGKANPRGHRAILSARPKSKGRQRLNRKGTSRASAMARSAESGAREPLLLITSLTDPPSVVARLYGFRMQIEETFRDLKSHRYGWSADLIRTRRARRVDMLLLIAALAALAMHVIGLALRGGVVARGMQANTARAREVFSTFFLAKLALTARIGDDLTEFRIRRAIGKLISKLPSVERIPT
jgi:hypothetical protein